MSVILTPDRWRRQPTGPLTIDWTHPSANGLQFAIARGDTRELLTGSVPASASGYPARGAGVDGQGRQFSTASDFYSGFSVLDTATTTSGFVLSRSAGAINSYQGLIAHTSALGTTAGWSAFQANAGDGATAVGVFLGATHIANASGVGWNTLSNSATEALGFSFVGGSRVAMYRSGRAILSTSTAGSPTTGAGYIKVASSRDVTCANTLVYEALLWNRELSSAEHAEIAGAPWALFKKSARILYFTSAGGGGTISGALESISLATFGATVASARDIAAALESVALTTSAARVSSDRAITASVEAISITTNAATVQAGSDTAISAGLESLTLTGHQASIATDRNVAATLEAITVTGLTATVSTSSNTNISAALESITVTVNPATVSRDSALAAALESLTVTPHAASIAVGQIVAAALEGLTLTSYPAGVALNVTLGTQLEQINLATFAAQVGLGTNVAALTEAITLTPHGATLTFAPSVRAARESITVTTFTASVIGGESILTTPGLEFTIPLNRLGYTIPIGRIHFTIPQE